MGSLSLLGSIPHVHQQPAYLSSGTSGGFLTTAERTDDALVDGVVLAVDADVVSGAARGFDGGHPALRHKETAAWRRS